MKPFMMIINKYRIQIITTIKALLIFFGVILVQIASATVCVLGYYVINAVSGEAYIDIIKKLYYMTENGSTFLMILSVMSASISFIWCAILYKRSNWRDEGIDYRKVFSVNNIAFIAASGAGGCVVLTTLLSILMNLNPSAFKDYNQVMENLDMSKGILTVVYVVIIGPISEELIFRGAIFDRFRIAYSFWIANALQALLFGVYHMNLIQGLYAFLLGMLLGMIAYATGSILASIATHMIFNATTYLLQTAALSGGIVFLILLLISIFILFLGVRYYLNMCLKKLENET